MVTSESELACTAPFLMHDPTVFFILFSNFDAKTGDLTLIMEIPRRHTPGAVPVHAF